VPKIAAARRNRQTQITCARDPGKLLLSKKRRGNILQLKVFI
jgi:hypothetical protein